MSKKQDFINFIDGLNIDMPDEIKEYYEVFKNGNAKEKPLFTDNGKMILQYLQNNPQQIMVKAKDIADGLGVSSRTVSGSIRKLVTDGFVTKESEDPVIYSISEKGKNIKLD